MRWFFAVLALLLVFTTTTVRAQEDLSEIASQLQRSPVYVGQGFPNVDDAVVGQLTRQLRQDDQIVLILLPEADYDIFTTDDLVHGLSEELGNQYIIGLALGNQVIAHAPTLPLGVASVLMDRAVGLSNNNPVTALSTFIQNVHAWQARNVMPTPVPTPLPPVEQTESGGGGFPTWLALGIGVPITGGIAVLLWFRLHRGGILATRFQIRSALDQIQEKKYLVNDWKLQGTIEVLVGDVNRYLDDETKQLFDLTHLRDNLKGVDNILEKYIDIQKNGRYYRNPELQLQQGKDSINDFKDAVLEMILQGSDHGLSEYRLDTNILKAQKEVLYL